MPPRTESGGTSLPRASTSTALSIYPTDSVQDVAESLGLPPLKESVAATLAADVEYRLRQVIQDASKFMRHGKRNQLRVADVDRALKQRNIEPILGFHPTTLGKSSVSGAYPTPVGSTFRRIQTQSGPIHLISDEEIDLDKVLDSGPKVGLGPGVGWSAHWLAIEGVQPAVPQNPVFASAVNPSSTTNSTATVPATSNAAHINGASAVLSIPGGAPGQTIAKPLIKHVLSRELQLYFERLTSAIIDPPKEAEKKNRESSNGDVVMKSVEIEGEQSQKNGTVEDVEAMSKETTGNTVRDSALASLRGDPGLHQLVPYLIQWVGERVQDGLRNEDVLQVMLHTMNAIVLNPFLGIDAYLHQLLPFVLSILLTSTLGASTSTLTYRLRVQAGSLLAYIIKSYGSTYPTLKPRLVRTALSALDAGCKESKIQEGQESQRLASLEGTTKGPRESSATKLGAVVGLRKMGPGAIRTLLVQERQESGVTDCYLKRLGRWCERVEAFDNRRDEVESIVQEINKSLHEMAIQTAAAAAAVDSEDDAELLQSSFGDYWVQKLSTEEAAIKTLKAFLSEARQYDQQNKS